MSLLLFFFGIALSYFISYTHLNQSSSMHNYLGWLTIFQYFVLSCLMLIVWWSAPEARKFYDVRVLVIFACIVRILLIPVDSYTSNDVQRYLFDGKIALLGLDPYQVNHNHPKLEEHKTKWAPPEEHAKYPTLYPPLSLALFSLAATTGYENAAIVWKIIASMAGILTLLILVLLLEKLALLRHLPLIALSPTLILETGIGAHVDSISTMFVAFTLYAFYAKRVFLTGCLISLGTLTKILPVMLLLPLFFGIKKPIERTKLILAALATIIAGYTITLSLGFIPIGSLGTLFEKWRFGSPFFSFLEWFTDGITLLSLIFTIFIISGFYIAYQTYKLKEKISITHPLLPWSLFIILLVSPVVFPWYFMPLIPLVVLNPRPIILTWICLTPLTYEVLNGFVSAGTWQPTQWPLFILVAGLLVSIYFELRMKITIDRKNSG